ncbi:major capsid family protein [Alloalcanivorax xenomutans]
MYTIDAQARAALSFLLSELTYVEQDVLRQPYPEIKYPSIIPISTEAGAYADSIAFKTLDFKGEPKLLGGKSGDVPLVELASGKGSVTVHTYSLGYDWSLIEAGKAQELAKMSRSAAINYLAEKPQAVRQLTEQFLDKAFFIGDSRTADVKTGLLNDPTVAVTDTGSLMGGPSMTIDQIIAQADKEKASQDLLALINNAILRVYITQTNTIFRPTHILLPALQYGKLMTTRIPNTAETFMSYLRKVLSEQGNSITFEPLIHLAGRGAGGTDRMMVYTRDQKYVKGHMPMPFGLQPPATADNITFVSAGLVRIAGTELRIPKQHLYVDGV